MYSYDFRVNLWERNSKEILLVRKMRNVLIFGTFTNFNTHRKDRLPFSLLCTVTDIKGHSFLEFPHTCSFKANLWQWNFYCKRIKARSNRRLHTMSRNLLLSFLSLSLRNMRFSATNTWSPVMKSPHMSRVSLLVEWVSQLLWKPLCGFILSSEYIPFSHPPKMTLGCPF